MTEPQEQAASDLQYKMSKKIAQLTKVVYQLNCRNEDNDSVQRSLANQYEDEITSIMTDAKEKIRVLKDELDSKREEKKLNRIVEEMNRQHQSEKQQAMRMFEDFRNKSAQQEMQVKKATDERVSIMTSELTGAKENFMKQIALLEDKLSAVNSEHAATIADLKQKKEEEINNLVLTYNEKYKAMLASQMEEQDKLEARLNSEWAAKLEALQSEGGASLADLTKQLSEEKAKNRSLGVECGTLKETVAELERIKSNLETEVFRANTKVEQLQEALKVTQAHLVASEEKTNNLESKCETLTNNLNEILSEHRDVKKENTELIAKVTDSEALISSLQAELRSLRDMNEEALAQGGSAAEQVKSLNLRMEELTQKLTDSEKLLAATRQELKKVDASLEESKSREIRQSARVSELEAELIQLKKTAEEDLAKLNREHAAAIAALADDTHASQGILSQQHAEALQALRKELEEQHANFLSGKQAEWRKKQTEREDELVGEHSEAVAKLKMQHQEELERLKAAHAAALDRLREEAQGTASSMMGEADTLRRDLEALKQQHQIDLTALDKAKSDEIAALKTANETLTDQIQKDLNARIQSLMSELAVVEQNEKAAREEKRVIMEKNLAEIALLNEEHQNALKTLREELEEKFIQQSRSGESDAAKKLASLRAQLAAERDAALQEARREHLAEIEKIRQEHNSISQHLEDKIRTLQAQISALESSGSAANAKHSDDLEKLREELRVAADTHRTSLEKLKHEHQKQYEELERVKSREYSELERTLKAEIAALTAAHAKTLNDLSDESRRAMKDLEESHKNKISSLERRKDEERETKLKEIQARLSGEMQRSNEQHAKEMEQMNAARESLEKELRLVSSQRDDTEKKWKQSELKSRGLEDELKQSKEANVKLADDHVRAIEALANKLSQEKVAALEQQATSFSDEKAHLQAAYEAEKAKLNDRIKHLKRAVADLEYKYANRESRQEDVDKINQLMKDNREKDDALIKAYNDMKFYKLELVNREESYNKVFGRQPTVQNQGSAADAPSDATKENTGGMAKSTNQPNIRRTKSIR